VTEAARGALFHGEIHEQPAALERLLDGCLEAVRAAAARAAGVRLVRLVAHGSSDNAASYGVYAFPLVANATAFRESISLLTYYRTTPDLGESLVVGISQSGRTPDVVEYVAAARGLARLTIAITNDTASPLAEAAEAVIPLCAGPELAVAATKTYTSTLAALALLAGALGGELDRTAEDLRRTASLMAGALTPLDAVARGVAALFEATGQMVVVGRGIEFATARELALKLTETCHLVASPLTTTDFSHGPIAGVGAHVPVWVIASEDPCLPAALEAATRARRAGAPLIASGSASGQVPEAAIRFGVPPAPTAPLSPLLSVLPGQLFAWALADAKGVDPDAPSGLSKVTVVP
jgi:glucosamine--fructose-6-phosphate aminotransferase (isomerizing)